MKMHRTKVALRFGDCDPAGVIFYPRAFELAHAAVEELIDAAVGRAAWFNSPTHTFPIRHAQADYWQAMKPGQTFEMVVKVEKTGVTSLAFAVDFVDEAGQIAARVRTVHVAVDRSSGKPVDISAEVRAALA